MSVYLDLLGFRRRTIMPAQDVDVLAELSPGFIEARIALRTSLVNARLRKRYGNNLAASALPFGATPPALAASGTSPPMPATLAGVPLVGSQQIVLAIVVGGTLGTATVKVSVDGGVSFAPPIATAATLALNAANAGAATGLSALFPAGTYGTDNAYTAPTAVPEAILGWLTALVTLDAYQRRGANPQDPQMVLVVDAATAALAELKEAADSKDGLFDLPVNEAADSAVTTGGPLGYSETSPFVWRRVEAELGIAEDIAHTGTGGTTD